MKKLLISIGLLLVIIPVNVKALTGNVYLNCNDTTLTLNEETTCSITANINEEVATINKMQITVGSALTLVSTTPDSIWEGSGEDGLLKLYTDEFKKGTFNIATFVIKGASETSGAKVSLEDVVLADAKYQNQTFTVTPVTVKVEEPVEQYTITYKLNGGTNPSGAKTTYTKNDTYTLPTPTKTGYTFDGWYTESTFTNKVTSIQKGTTGNKTFYAKWEENTPEVTIEKITSVKVNGIVTPTVGMSASPSGISVGGSNYTISTIHYSVSDSATGTYEALKATDKFVEGKYYRLYIELSPNTGYEFTSDTVVDVGQTANSTYNETSKKLIVTIDYGQLETIIVSPEVDYYGNLKVDFPDTTDKPLNGRNETKLEDYTMRYQYVGLDIEKDKVIADIYKRFKECEASDKCTDTEKAELIEELLKALPEFDEEKWTDVESEHLVPFNAQKSESGNYILYVELKDEVGNISYAYDYVLSDAVKEYVGPSTSDNLPIILISIIGMVSLAVVGYRKLRMSN